MAERSYSQYCGLAQALDLVGERWALLVVRELLAGPKRYSDLLSGLPGISTNVLAARLQELEGTGVVKRKTLAPPAASAVYELTDYGRELDEVVLALGRWGGRSLGSPTPERIFLPGWGLLALRASFRPDRATGLRGAYEFRIDGEVFHLVLKGRRADMSAGPAARPDLVVTVDAGTFLELGLGELDPEEAVRTGRAELVGEPARFARLYDAFRFPAAEPAT
jgi:DNA-binding HxlR family transcriptional regulator